MTIEVPDTAIRMPASNHESGTPVFSERVRERESEDIFEVPYFDSGAGVIGVSRSMWIFGNHASV